MNRQDKVTRRTLHTISHSLMVHARLLEVYINLTLIYTTDNIFKGIPVKDMINLGGDPSTPFKTATGTKPSVS